MSNIDLVKNELMSLADPEKVPQLKKYFKAMPGGYGEGDEFIGMTVPQQRKIAKKYYKEIFLEEINALLKESIHEFRQTALFLLVNKFAKAKDVAEKESIVNLYLNNLKAVNNWDLVDSSAPFILGAYLSGKENKELLYNLARSGDLWKERVAILSTFYFIKEKQFADTFVISEILLKHKHDLIHKAVGWMLREVGNQELEAEIAFLKVHYKVMPRTMLRYAIEKFEPQLREKFMKGLI
jgi:3-methyladenine DNA glycosylase AlkD